MEQFNIISYTVYGEFTREKKKEFNFETLNCVCGATLQAKKCLYRLKAN